MKILHLASEYPPQEVFGLGRFVHDLAVEQARQGHEVHVVTNSLSGRDHDIVDGGVHVHRVDYPPPPKPPDDGATVTQFNVQLVERVLRDRICPDADVVNAHDWLTALAGSVVARRWGALFAVTIHDVVVGKKLGELDDPAKYVGNIEHWVCHEADRVICVSSYMREQVIRTYGAPPEKAHAIHNAVFADAFPRPDTKLLARFRRVLARDDERIVLYVGRLDREKGVDVLLRAFANARRGAPDAKLIIAGKGALLPELKRLAAGLGIEEAVVFTGYIADGVLVHVLHSGQVLVVPSLYEPFGIVALEAMACGLPIIASATGGLTEIVEDGRTGLLVEPGDTGALGLALTRLLGDEALAQRLASAGRRRVEEEFCWARVAERIERILTGASVPDARPPAPPTLDGERKPLRLLLVVQTHTPDFHLLEANREAYRALVGQGHMVALLCYGGEGRDLAATWCGTASVIEADVPRGHHHLVRKTAAGYRAALGESWDWLVKIDSDTLICGDIPAFLAAHAAADAVGAPSTFGPVRDAIRRAGPPDVRRDCLDTTGQRYLRGFFYGVRRDALRRALPLLERMAPRMRVEDATVTAALASTGARVAFCEYLSADCTPERPLVDLRSPVLHVESRTEEERSCFAEWALATFRCRLKPASSCSRAVRAQPKSVAKLRDAPPKAAPRVLFDGRLLGQQRTGVGCYASRVLRAMLTHDRRYDWAILCHPEGAALVTELTGQRPNARPVVLEMPVASDPRSQHGLLAKLIPELQADLFFSPAFGCAPRHVCQSVSVIHDVAFDLHPEFFPKGVAEHLHGCVVHACQNTSHLIAVSENTKAEIVRIYDYPPDRIVSVPLAADDRFSRDHTSAELQAVRTKYGLSTRYVLCVNAGHPKKNVATLLRAFARLEEASRDGVQLVVVGEWKREWVDIPELAGEMGIGDKVVLTGFVSTSDLECLYAGALLFCFPSLHEGFGLPVLEAMASGVPVICSDAASLPEVAGDAAILVPPKDEAGWAEALGQMLESAELREQRVEQGHRHARQFSWARTARRTLDVIRASLAGGSPASGAASEPRLARTPPQGSLGRRQEKRILFVSQHPLTHIGGAERSALALLSRLRERGWVCHAVSLQGDGAAERDGVRLLAVPSADHVAGVAQHVRPDMLFTQLAWSPLATQLARGLALPSVVFLRSLEPFCADPIRFGTCDRRCDRCAARRQQAERIRAQQKGLCGATLVVANSQYMRSVARDMAGVEAPVVYPIIDFAAVRARRGPRDSLLINSPLAHKGGSVFFETARRMPDEHFLCVGTGRGPDLPNVQYLGPTDPRDFYARSRLVLVPSIVPEAFGRMAPEAMWNGIPVLASNLGGLPEAVGDGGILINNYTDVQSWVNATRYVLAGDNYAHFAAAAPAQARRFEPERQMDALSELLETCHA